MRLTGIVVILIALAVPLLWFVPLATRHDPIAIASEYLGVSALVAMAFSQLLATRISLLQFVFGGQDRIYVLHKWLGIGAIAAILLHEAVDAEVSGLGRETALSDFAESLGEFGYYGLLALVAITVLPFIPYHWWRWTHKLMGAMFTLAVLHFALIMKPFATLDPPGLYVLSFGLMGIASYLLTLVPHQWRYAANRYKVSELKQEGGAVAVTLAPLRAPLSHQSGQFAFVQFRLPGCDEVHPFSISKCSDQSGNLRFTIKQLGDFTRQLRDKLTVGTEAIVSRPFGRFIRKPGATAEIWVSGGIGVTPFVAWAQTLDAGHPPIRHFHCAKSRASAPHLNELEAISNRDDGFHLHFVDSSTGDRLSADAIVQETGGSLAGVQVYFCGPKSMREALRTGLRRHGLPSSAFHFEEFEIRSGIGLRRLAHWFVARFKDRKQADGRPLRAS